MTVFRVSRFAALSLVFAVNSAGCDDPVGTDPGTDAGPIIVRFDAGEVAPGTDAGPVPPGQDAGTPPVTPGCTPQVLACADQTIAAVPAMASGSTSGSGDDFGGSTCAVDMQGGMGGTGAADLSFAFTAPSAGPYIFDTVGSSFDTLLVIRDACGGTELACNDDIARGMRQSSVEVQLQACQTVLVIVDGYSAGEAGSATLRVSTRESVCNDGVDNDGDGLGDCDDPDCFSVECNGGDDWPIDWQRFEVEVLRLSNEERARGHNCDTEGVFGPTHPLEMDTLVREAARGHALDMGQRNYFEHDSLDGRTFSDRMSATGFMGDYPWGENIAAGQTTPREVVDGWLDSDGHCANLMSPEYRVIGIGYAYVESSEARHYWVQDFAASH